MVPVWQVRPGICLFCSLDYVSFAMIPSSFFSFFLVLFPPTLMKAFYRLGYDTPGDFVGLIFVCIVFPSP